MTSTLLGKPSSAVLGLVITAPNCGVFNDGATDLRGEDHEKTVPLRHNVPAQLFAVSSTVGRVLGIR